MKLKCALVGSRFFGASVFEALRKEEFVSFLLDRERLFVGQTQLVGREMLTHGRNELRQHLLDRRTLRLLLLLL